MGSFWNFAMKFIIRKMGNYVQPEKAGIAS